MHEYGEWLYKGRPWSNQVSPLLFRYRYDPVPNSGVWRYRFRYWYKTSINCLQEKKAGMAYPEYTRGKRMPKSLPNVWDDWQRSDCKTRRSWKNKKIRKQWMKNHG